MAKGSIGSRTGRESFSDTECVGARGFGGAPVRYLAIAMLAVALASCQTVASEQVDEVRLTSLLQEFCLDTEMRLQPFKALASEQGFEALVRVVRAGDDYDSSKWEFMYRRGPVSIGMDGTSADRSHATYCGVMVITPADDWRGDIERLAKSLGMEPTEAVASGSVRETRAWSRDGQRPLSLNYKLYESRVALNLNRSAADQSN